MFLSGDESGAVDFLCEELEEVCARFRQCFYSRKFLDLMTISLAAPATDDYVANPSPGKSEVIRRGKFRRSL